MILYLATFEKIKCCRDFRSQLPELYLHYELGQPYSVPLVQMQRLASLHSAPESGLAHSFQLYDFRREEDIIYTSAVGMTRKEVGLARMLIGEQKLEPR